MKILFAANLPPKSNFQATFAIKEIAVNVMLAKSWFHAPVTLQSTRACLLKIVKACI